MRSWAIGACRVWACIGNAVHEPRELAVGNAQQGRDLIVFDLECDSDHVIVVTLVSEPNRHRMQGRQLPDSRGSIHIWDGKEPLARCLECSLLRLPSATTQGIPWVLSAAERSDRSVTPSFVYAL